MGPFISQMKKTFHFTCLCTAFLQLNCTQSIHYINQPKKYSINPPIIFMTMIVSYRETKGIWPVSLDELKKVSEENRNIVKNFPFENARFILKKKDVLIIYFSGYKKDPQFTYPQPNQQLDHRIYSGSVRFYRSKGRFTWDAF